MSKVVFNNDWGGYSLPDEILEEYCKRTGINFNEDSSWELVDSIPRHDPVLVEIVENYIKTKESTLCVTDIGNAIKYYIEDYDGVEYVYTTDSIPWQYVDAKLSIEDL